MKLHDPATDKKMHCSFYTVKTSHLRPVADIIFRSTAIKLILKSRNLAIQTEMSRPKTKPCVYISTHKKRCYSPSQLRDSKRLKVLKPLCDVTILHLKTDCWAAMLVVSVSVKVKAGNVAPWKPIHRRNGGKTPPMLNIGPIWRWANSFTSQLLCPRRKNCRYWMNKRLGSHHSRSRRGERKINISCI
jgi:hypothetical protein